MNKLIVPLLFPCAIVYCVYLLLSIVGITTTLNADLPDLWTPGYVWPVLIHSFYGLLLFASILASGTTVLHLSSRRFKLDDNDVRILGIPAGLLVCLGASLIAQLGMVGQLLAVLAITGAIIYYGLRTHATRRVSNQYIALVIILAIAMGAVFAFIWKPTIESHTGSMGAADTTIFSGWYYSLKAGIYPFYTLGSEGEVNGYGYFNNLHTFFALGMDFLPHFNIYLFNMAGISTFFVLSTVYMLRALSLYRNSIGCEPLAPISKVLVTVLFIAASRHPSWIVESPPVAFMTPITLAVLYSVLRAGNNVVRLGLALALAVVGSALSKVVTLSILGAYTGVKLLQQILRSANLFYLILLGVLSCLIAGYILYMLQSFAPQFATDWEPGPAFWSKFQDKGWGQFHKVVPKLFKDLGLVVIVGGVFALKDIALLAAAVLAVITNFIFPFLFTATPASLLILVAGYIVAVDSIPKRARWLLLVGATLFLPHHWRHDTGSWYPFILWVFTLGIAVYTTLAIESRQAGARPESSGTRWIHVLCALMVLCVTLTALATGSLRVGQKKLELIPLSLHDIWTSTRENSPGNALIFTDQTGDNRGRLSGWNDYSLMAQRQFYISTWSNGPLRYEEAARKERLSNNEAILSGAKAPTDLALSKRYSGYFAVVAKARPVPANFSRIYANSDYALYRIQPDQHP